MRLLRALLLLLLSTIPAAIYGETTLPELVATLELDRKEALVKEQILLKLKVGYPIGAFALTQTTLTASNAELVSLQKSESTEKHNGLPYKFVQTTYALFANSAGQINLAAINFNALLPVSAGGSNSNRNPEINAVIEPGSININPAPVDHPALVNNNTPHQWLAASDVTLTSQWQLREEALVPGLPMVRKIVINVSGQHPAAVNHSLDMRLPDGLRAYPAAVDSVIEKKPDGLGGSVTLPVTLVASAPGIYNLPAISIPWWDINQQKWRKAVLSEEILEIIPAQDNKNRSFGSAIWIAVATGLGLMCLAIPGLIYFSQKHKSDRHQSPVSEKHAWHLLQKSVKTGVDQDTRTALLGWATAIDPEQSVVRLEQVANRFPQLRPVVFSMNQRLYGRSQRSATDKQTMLRALRDARQSVLAKKNIVVDSKGLYPKRITH